MDEMRVTQYDHQVKPRVSGFEAEASSLNGTYLFGWLDDCGAFDMQMDLRNYNKSADIYAMNCE